MLLKNIYFLFIIFVPIAYDVYFSYLLENQNKDKLKTFE